MRIKSEHFCQGTVKGISKKSAHLRVVKTALTKCSLFEEALDSDIYITLKAGTKQKVHFFGLLYIIL